MEQSFRAWLSEQAKTYPRSLDGFIPAVRDIMKLVGAKTRIPTRSEFSEAAYDLGIPASEAWDCLASAIIAHHISQMEPVSRSSPSKVLLFEARNPVPVLDDAEYSYVRNGCASHGSGNAGFDSDWVFFDSEAAAYVFARAMRMSSDVNQIGIRVAQRVAWNWPETPSKSGQGWGPGVAEQYATILLPQFVNRDTATDSRMIRGFVEGVDPESSYFQFRQKPKFTVKKV